ncbi:MAG: Ig-like domain-containing protein, partial [Anaerohalosphaeraceae bacterium]
VLIVISVTLTAQARKPYRTNFFNAYPNAVGSVLDDVPSNPGHCGVCHYDFDGSGLKNPFGLAVEATDRSEAAILALGSLDSDGDGYSNDVEITDTITYGNTPTFPGLKASNVGGVINVALTDIQTHLTPSTGSDTTPPVVTVIAPNGGETLTANTATTVEWTATDTDGSGVASIDLYLSLDNGSTFSLVAQGLSNSGSYTWFPANRPSTVAIFRVEATDNAFNTGSDDSDTVFEIASPAGGLVPTTLRDFDQPGTQPFEAGTLNSPEACEVCHGGYDASMEPYFNWQGSMMAQASIDPLFKANMEIANQDAPDSGDLCLRCHLPRGWLQGRSVPTDGSAMLSADESGVSCDLCHRMLDPIYEPSVSPIEDFDILAGLSNPTLEFGNGMYTVDPTGARRGPFINATTGHAVLVSPFHREAALCGTCHDVSNPAFEKDGNGGYVPNDFDTPATDFSPNTLLPVERTYSEWLHSAYNTQEGVYDPAFGGNKAFVATCQDCHMQDITGQGCDPNQFTPPVRDDLPLHDMTGGSTWLPGVLAQTHPGQVNVAALDAGVERARYMLQNAADLEALQTGGDLKVTVTNRTGHKLPTGYPEGRRMWLNVQFYNDANQIISESGAYDPVTGVLTHDEAAKIYEIEPAIDDLISGVTGIPAGKSFHFVLNSTVAKDNRIPPRGYDPNTFATFGGNPVNYSYDPGQHWDDTQYEIPIGATSAQVTLYYQSTSKEFVEFLRDENHGTPNNEGAGLEMYNLWNNNGKCPPEIMQQVQMDLIPTSVPADLNLDFVVNLEDFAIFAEYWLWSYPGL